MTRPGLTVIVRCGARTAHLHQTLRSLRRPTAAPDEIIVLVDPTTPDAFGPTIEAMAHVADARVIHVGDANPASGLQVGLKASSTRLVTWLLAGERLAPTAIAAIHHAVNTHGDLAGLTTAATTIGPEDETRRLMPLPTTVAGLVAQAPTPWGLTIVDRDAVLGLGGLDAEAAPLHDVECLLRLASDGRVIVAIDQPLVSVPWPPRFGDVLPDATAAAMAHIVRRHAAAFSEHAAAVLHAREIDLEQTAARHRQLHARHRAAQDELAARPPACGGTVPVDLGDMRRTSPIDRDWGYTRGTPLDRHYIEMFLERHALDIGGLVLEIQENDYTHRFGGAAVTRSDVLDIDASNPRANVIGDLRDAPHLVGNTYDCIVLTQVAHVIDDMPAVIRECARLLRPGGVLLATFPATSRVCVEYGIEGDHWRLTAAGARHLFDGVFPAEALDIANVGNALAATAFVQGLAVHELTESELAATDPYHPLLVTVRAEKPHPGASVVVAVPPEGIRWRSSQAILLYHRVAEFERDSHEIAVSPSRFAEQMRHLSQHCHVWPVERLAEAMLAGSAPPGAVAITFDDGYLDTLSVAAPILAAIGLPATCLVTSEALDAPEYKFWWDRLESAWLAPGWAGPDCVIVPVNGGQLELDAHDEQARHESHWAMYHAIVSSPADDRDMAIAALTQLSGREAVISARRMTGRELKSLSQHPFMSVGAHSVRHPVLPTQAAAIQAAELAESRRAIEAAIGRNVATFAYPHGAVSPLTARLAREAGYRFAFTCTPERAATVDGWQLPRLEVNRTVTARFEDVVPRRH